MLQGLLFDLGDGVKAKLDGMECAVSNRTVLLQVARDIAHDLGSNGQEVHADMVMRRLITNGIRPTQLGNAAGAIFTRSEWVFTGRWHRSRRVSNHARCIRIWRLKV